MTETKKTYIAKDIEVTYEPGRCNHMGACIENLPAVFDTNTRPWVKIENGTADEIARTILLCPTGALHFTRKDDGINESVPDQNTIEVDENGPLYLTGRIMVKSAEGEVIVEDTRVGLCRCGASKNMPFCDNAHSEIGFKAPGRFSVPNATTTEAAPGPLEVTVTRNGPYELSGPFVLVSPDRKCVYHATSEQLCRCGYSSTQPFCDNTHLDNGFEG